MKKLLFLLFTIIFSTFSLSHKWEKIHSENGVDMYYDVDSIQKNKFPIVHFTALINFQGKTGEMSTLIMGLIDCDNQTLGFDRSVDYSKVFAQGEIIGTDGTVKAESIKSDDEISNILFARTCQK